MDGPADQGSGIVHTYHCICANLLIAATRPLSWLPRRNTVADASYILPLPPQSSMDAEALGKENSGHYATLLSTTLDRKPVVIRRDDGFEKRYLHRCARCALVFGYMLDWSQFGTDSSTGSSGPAAPTTGRRTDVVYILPGGVQSTGEMASGADLRDSALSLLVPRAATGAGSATGTGTATKLSG